MSTPFRVQQIDHVELLVPDRYEAARWYKQVLGLEIMAEYEDWARAGGPLMISSDGGRTMLALFERTPERAAETFRCRRVAFRVDGPGFVRFLARLDELVILNDAGERLTAGQVVDHQKAYSIYFQDPYGNLYEVTTYDYDYVANYRLAAAASASDSNKAGVKVS